MARTTAIVSGSAIGSGLAALTTLVARTEKHRDHREDAAVLAEDHPSQPVPADEENRAQADGEVPGLRRGETVKIALR